MEQATDHGHDDAAATVTVPSSMKKSGLQKFSDWVNANSPEVPLAAETDWNEAVVQAESGGDTSREPLPSEERLKGISALVFKIAGVAAGVVLVAVLLGVVAQLPIFGSLDSPAINEVYARYLEKAIEETGAVNAVAGMILDYRAFDTFGESVVLFTAVLSVSFLLNKGKQNKPKDEKSGEKEHG